MYLTITSYITEVPARINGLVVDLCTYTEPCGNEASHATSKENWYFDVVYDIDPRRPGQAVMLLDVMKSY